MNMDNSGEYVCDRPIITICPATRGDLVAVADVHAAAFRNYFLTLMGQRFVIEYYLSVLDFYGGIVLLARDSEGSVVGFVAGFSDAESFYAHYKNRRYKLAILSFAAILRKPSLLGRAVRNAVRVGRGVAHIPQNSNDLELSSLGVLPQYQKYGIGGKLIEGFIARARDAGAENVYLTTDAIENESINAFYIKRGFVLEKVSAAGKRELNVYRHNLEYNA